MMEGKPQWYVLHTISSYENVAKENLEMVRENFNLHDRIFEIRIPTEEVIEEKNGKKKIVTRKILPSYILIKMIYGDDIWHAITRTRGVTGFVGPKGRPLALTEEEVQKMHLEEYELKEELSIGDTIEVIDGPLNSCVGKVVAIDNVARRIKANVEMFGRETAIDLEYSQIKKI